MIFNIHIGVLPSTVRNLCRGTSGACETRDHTTRKHHWENEVPDHTKIVPHEVGEYRRITWHGAKFPHKYFNSGGARTCATQKREAYWAEMELLMARGTPREAQGTTIMPRCRELRSRHCGSADQTSQRPFLVRLQTVPTDVQKPLQRMPVSIWKKDHVNFQLVQDVAARCVPPRSTLGHLFWVQLLRTHVLKMATKCAQTCCDPPKIHVRMSMSSSWSCRNCHVARTQKCLRGGARKNPRPSRCPSSFHATMSLASLAANKPDAKKLAASLTASPGSGMGGRACGARITKWHHLTPRTHKSNSRNSWRLPAKPSSALHTVSPEWWRSAIAQEASAKRHPQNSSTFWGPKACFLERWRRCACAQGLTTLWGTSPWPCCQDPPRTWSTHTEKKQATFSCKKDVSPISHYVHGASVYLGLTGLGLTHKMGKEVDTRAAEQSSRSRLWPSFSRSRVICKLCWEVLPCAQAGTGPISPSPIHATRTTCSCRVTSQANHGTTSAKSYPASIQVSARQRQQSTLLQAQHCSLSPKWHLVQSLQVDKEQMRARVCLAYFRLSAKLIPQSPCSKQCPNSRQLSTPYRARPSFTHPRANLKTTQLPTTTWIRVRTAHPPASSLQTRFTT